jgi:aldo/keto reductase family protein
VDIRADLRHTLDDRFTPIEEPMSALDDLVKSGKLSYVGIFDALAWKVAQAQVMAHFRGWNPLIALQIEYLLPVSSGLSIRISVPRKRSCRHLARGLSFLFSLQFYRRFAWRPITTI